MEENNLEIISGSYDPVWVALSVVIAIFASYTALNFAHYVTKTLATTYKIWLAFGAISMGTGIWSMHFVGMLAFRLPLPVNYDIFITLLSLIVAILASGFALFVISRHHMDLPRWIGGGILMGLGIASMHYTGMAAMVMDASMAYQPSLFILSILIAIAVSMAALRLAFKLRDDNGRSLLWQKIISAHVMGFAIAGMHYTGMAAAIFSTSQPNVELTSAIPANTWLVAFISITTLLLLVLSLVALRVDQYITTKDDALLVSHLRNKQIMDNAADVIITINERGLIESFNLAGERTFGYSNEELIGKNISCLMPEPYSSQHDEYLKHYKTGGTGNIVGGGAREVKALHNNGTSFPIELSVSEIHLDNQHRLFIGIIRDITARKQSEIELKKSHARLQEAHHNLQETHQQLLQSEKMASIGQLAAGVAHEINNPIGYISSNIGTLQQYVSDLCGLLDNYEQLEVLVDNNNETLQHLTKEKEILDLQFIKQDIVELLHESQEGISRVKNIVQDLKDFSHVGEDKWQLADLHKGLNSTLNIIHNEIKYHADVIKEYGDLPVVKCLASQLNQVFMNILLNAAHAIEGRGTITIQTGVEKDQVWIKFSDTGKGIPADHLKKIFDPFFTTKPIGKGTGLGLSLSYGIIKKHNGNIEVESTVGKGTCFRILLPIEQKKVKE